MADSFFVLWFTQDRSKYFLVPNSHAFAPGAFIIKSLDNRVETVALDNMEAFEITEDQARRWAKDQLGQALAEVRAGIDDKLAGLRRQLDEFNRQPVSEDGKVTPNVISALLDLVKQLPGVVGQSLSGNDSRVEAASSAMADLQRRLQESGINVDDRLGNFPNRLAEIRRDAEKELAVRRASKKEPPREDS